MLKNSRSKKQLEGWARGLQGPPLGVYSATIRAGLPRGAAAQTIAPTLPQVRGRSMVRTNWVGCVGKCMPGVIIRVAEYPGLLECELPRPAGGQLVVAIERRSFHRSPGPRFFRCLACGELRGVLVEVATADQHPGWRAAREHPAAQALGWACRRCAGLPHSRAWGRTACGVPRFVRASSLPT